MKLYGAAPSPYVRKVRVLAAETGVDAKLELIVAQVTPLAPDGTITDANPIGKIPTLVLDDGTALYDSRVICEYLDTQHSGTRMFPEQGPARFRALTDQALADGMLDAAVIARYETFLRPEKLRWQDWTDNQKLKFGRALDQLEARAGEFPGRHDIGTIAIGCALGYLDFRYDADRWRDGRPALSAWYKDIESRPSMQSTKPE